MVYCAELVAAFSTAARRDQVLADVQTFMARPRWEAEPSRVEAVDLSNARWGIPGGQFGLIAKVRFTARQDAVDLLARVRAFATGARLPLAGSRIAIHDCAHDVSAPAPCSVAAGDRTVW